MKQMPKPCPGMEDTIIIDIIDTIMAGLEDMVEVMVMAKDLVIDIR